MKKYSDNKFKKANVLIPFFIVLIIKLIFVFMAYPVRTQSDEIATISAAAYVAGLDWSNVVSHAGYYGTGFSITMFPIFLLSNNPIVIYRCMLIICVIVQSIPSIISYYIMEKYLKIKDKTFLMIASIASSFFVVTRAVIVYNEHMLILISWIVFLLLIKLQTNIDNKKKHCLFTIILFLLLAYSLTIHTRALTLWLALIISYIAFLWINKKSFLSVSFALGFGTMGYLISKIYVNFIQHEIWIIQSGEKLRNSSITLGNKIENLFQLENWQAWLNIVIGQINTITIFSGGIVIIIIVMIFHWIWMALLRNKNFQIESNTLGSKLILPSIFFVSCIAMTILAQSITWLKGASYAMSLGFENNDYGTKAFSYIRYFGPYCGPLFMIGLSCIYFYKDKLLTYYKIALGSFIGIQIYWSACVVPYFYNTQKKGVLEVFLPYSLSKRIGEETSLMTILPASMIIFIVICIIGVCLKKGYVRFIAMLICAILIWEYSYNSIIWDIGMQKATYAEAEQGYLAIKDLEEEFELPKEIYVFDGREQTDHEIFYEYQLLLNRYKIIPGLPTTDEGKSVILTYNAPEDIFLDIEYTKYILDNQTSLYIKGL